MMLWVLFTLHCLHFFTAELLTTTDPLSIENVESFKTLPIRYEVYKNWPKLSLMEKIPFLIDRYYLLGIRDNFIGLSTDVNSDIDHVRGITGDGLMAAFKEFQTAEVVGVCFKYCDNNRDSIIDWSEYLVCRGYFDRYCNPFDLSEYDFLENIVIANFREQLNDPENPLVLQLIAQGEL
jgi:hypothetical protein